jgi:hypothetical protein
MSILGELPSQRLFARSDACTAQDPSHFERLLACAARILAPDAARLIFCFCGEAHLWARYAWRRRRLCDGVRARRVRAGTEMKGASPIPAAVAIIPSPLFLSRVKVILLLYTK